MNNDSRGLLIKAEQARELGDFKMSLELLSNAIVVIHGEHGEEKLVDVTSSQSLVYRHLFEKTGSENFLILAEHAGMASVELARKYRDPTSLSIALYNLGKVEQSLGLMTAALKNYKEAIDQDVDRVAMKAENGNKACCSGIYPR